MDMQTRPPQTGMKKTKRRDKLEMAWRHKSRSEKTLIKVIGFLVIVLLCFIIAVIAMDFGFKAKIQDLEDEISDLESPTPQESTTTITHVTEEPDFSTTTEPSISTTSPETTTTSVSTEEPGSSSTTDEATTSDATTESNPSSTSQPEALFEALRSLLRNFSGMKTLSSSTERITPRGRYTSKSRGTFIIMADIDQEEYQSITPEPTLTSVPILHIDSNETSSVIPPEDAVNNSTSEVFEDMEDAFETTTPDEGSGEGVQGSTLPP